jgi:hypothetical protein
MPDGSGALSSETYTVFCKRHRAAYASIAKKQALFALLAARHSSKVRILHDESEVEQFKLLFLHCAVGQRTDGGLVGHKL